MLLTLGRMCPSWGGGIDWARAPGWTGNRGPARRPLRRARVGRGRRRRCAYHGRWREEPDHDPHPLIAGVRRYRVQLAKERLPLWSQHLARAQPLAAIHQPVAPHRLAGSQSSLFLGGQKTGAREALHEAIGLAAHMLVLGYPG